MLNGFKKLMIAAGLTVAVAAPVAVEARTHHRHHATQASSKPVASHSAKATTSVKHASHKLSAKKKLSASRKLHSKSHAKKLHSTKPKHHAA